MQEKGSQIDTVIRSISQKERQTLIFDCFFLFLPISFVISDHFSWEFLPFFTTFCDLYTLIFLKREGFLVFFKNENLLKRERDF